jgi:ribosomal protein L34
LRFALLIDTDVSQRPTDVTLLAPTVTALAQLDTTIGAVTEILADAGYYSAANLPLCAKAAIVPYIPNRRERHAGGLLRLRTRDGRKIYGERKATIEPVFGVIKYVLGFRQFLLRGICKVKSKWKIVTTAYNLKRLHKLGLAC